MIETAGRWNPHASPIIFAAGHTEQAGFSLRSVDYAQEQGLQAYWEQGKALSRQLNKLVSMWSFYPQHKRDEFAKIDASGWLNHYDTVFFDSGVFSLAMQHAAQHAISHDDALRLPVNQIDCWEHYIKFYLAFCRKHGARSWGYVEIDLGGAAQKVKTRDFLEAKGLSPIPVWHPLNDGLEYGKMLFARYDRVCVGNLVKADEETRLLIFQLIAKLKHTERRRPWVHCLGVNIHPHVMSFPQINSIDAISWLSPLMYQKRATYAGFHKFHLEAPRLYDDRKDYYIACTLLNRQFLTNQANWDSLYERMRQCELKSMS